MHFQDIMTNTLYLNLSSEHLLDGKLCIAAAAVLLDPIEDQVGPGVQVQLPRLLLQLLDSELEVGQSGCEVGLAVGFLLLRLRQSGAELVEVPHDVGQGFVDILLPVNNETDEGCSFEFSFAVKF